VNKADLRNSLLGLAGLCLAGLFVIGAGPRDPARTQELVTKALALGDHAGECSQCHSAHGTAQGDLVFEHALIGPDDNTLCARCHTTPWTGGSFGDTWTYTGSAHGLSPDMIWPGPSPPARTETNAANKCVNCHDPHGREDASGLVPSLCFSREESLCLACHDGSPATRNIGAEFAKPYRHPTTNYGGRHRGALESQSADFGAAPTDNRHAECEDCHNPHLAYADRGGLPPAPLLSRLNLGVSRVLVQNGSPGAPPAYYFTPGSDTLSTPVAEFQLCFKCHSSWTIQPTGQTDLARELNPANPSYHPVEGVGRNVSIDPGAFVVGWSAGSLTRCGDCHGTDVDGGPEGPHGSAYRYILRQPYTASAQPRSMGSDEICFRCHAYDAYANPLASATVLGYSRFNEPGAGKGHAKHVGEEQVPCYACHVTHGSGSRPFLVATGRVPGIVSYAESPTGGSCQPTCHGLETYTVNYAR
jgi:predicted CXXCH cytochrome family protein